MRVAGKKEEIMQAALEIIAEQGFHSSPIAEIAARAEVAAGTIYRYFESKEVLISELRRELENEISAALLKDYPADRPLQDRFHHILRGLIGHFIGNPLHFRYLEQYFNSPYGVALRREMLCGDPKDGDILLNLFDEGLDLRLLRALPKPVLLAMAMGPMLLLMRDHVLGFVVLDDKLVSQVTEASWAAIKS